MGNVGGGSGSEFTLRMSVKGGVEQTLNSYFSVSGSEYTSPMLIFNIPTHSLPFNPLVTNLILY